MEKQKPELCFCYYYPETNANWKVIALDEEKVWLYNFDTRTAVEKSLEGFAAAVENGTLKPLYTQNEMVKAYRALNNDRS